MCATNQSAYSNITSTGSQVTLGFPHSQIRLRVASLKVQEHGHTTPIAYELASDTYYGLGVVTDMASTPWTCQLLNRAGHGTAGMQVNLSLTPQACDACIRRKQTHSAVPKIHEGPKADRPLEQVFVDLSGPQSITSCSGFCYIMNIIDDFSGYHWMHLLKAKSEAARVMQDWLLAAETQSHKKLCYFVTDNGELRDRKSVV